MKFLEIRQGKGTDAPLEYSNKYLKTGDIISNYGSVVQVVSEVPKHVNEKLLGYIDSGIISSNSFPTGRGLYQESDNSHFIELGSNDTRKIQLWKIRSINFGMDPSKMRISKLDISILICLFSANGVSAISNDGYRVPFNQLKNISGKKFDVFEVQESFTHYELESILRLTGGLKKMIGGNGNMYKQVRLKLPITAYFIYGLEEFLKGAIGLENLLALFGAFRSRGEKIIQFFRKQAAIPVVLDDSLFLIQDYILTSLRNGIVPQLEDAVEILEGDALWRVVLSYKKPRNWNDLASDISEAVSEIYCTYRGEGSPSILLKNPKEEGTLNLTKKITRHIERVTGIPMGIIGIYSYEQIDINNSIPVIKRRMYDISGAPTVEHAKTLIHHY